MLCSYSIMRKKGSNELADSTSSAIRFLRYRRSKTLQADTCFEKEHSHDRNMFLVIKFSYMVIVPSNFVLFRSLQGPPPIAGTALPYHAPRVAAAGWESNGNNDISN